MEVPGKKLEREASSVDRTFCQPCSQDGDTLPAEAYCTVCKEFLCTTCVNAHRKLKITKGHALLNKSKMPTSMGDQEDEDECAEPCDIHPKEFIKYFCSDHQTLNCGHCLAIEHRSCRVDVISDVAKSFKEGQEYDDITKTIPKILQEITDYSYDVEKNIKLVLKTGENEIARIRMFREEVNKYFEEQESSLLKIIKQMKNMDETLLDSLKLKSEGLKSNLQELTAHIEAQKNNIQLFIEAKRVKTQVESMKNALADLIKENTIHHYEFRKDTVTERLLTSNTGLGTVEIIVPAETISSAVEAQGVMVPTAKKRETMAAEQPTLRHNSVSVDLNLLQFTPATSIPVKSPTDKMACWLSSILILPGNRLLLADISNSTLKLVDLHTISMTSQINVPDRLSGGMCFIPGNRVAATIRSKGIQFLEIREQLALGDSIKVNGECRDVTFYVDRLIVSHFHGDIEIMDMKGNVIRKINIYGSGQNKMKSPLYLELLNEGQAAFIYVSNFYTNAITKLDMELNIIQKFQDPALNGPRGISVIGNTLVVCGYKSNNIMSLDLVNGQMKQLLGLKEGIKRPEFALYCPQKKKLFVASYNWNNAEMNNLLKVYYTTV